MSMMMGAMAIQSMTLMNPISVAVTILAISIVAAAMMFKASLSSWLAMILILTFSSGMMTLFMYTAAMSANEKNNKKTKKAMMMVVMVIPLMMKESKTDMKESMKTFSNKKMLILMTMVLILTILAISSNGHNPNQTLNTSF